MLQNGVMLEAVSRESIEVEGVSYRVFKSFLKFLYTDRLDLRCLLSQTDDSKTKCRRLIELLVAADKYATDRLKRLCEKLILRLMDITNAPEIYQVALHAAADVHRAESLKAKCVNYMVRHFDVVSKVESKSCMHAARLRLLCMPLLGRPDRVVRGHGEDQSRSATGSAAAALSPSRQREQGALSPGHGTSPFPF
eukprot:Polyplicarium_translucidae@DN3130_c0_g1_i1.p1